MRDVNGTQRDRAYLEAGLQQVLKETIAVTVSARSLPETRESALREQERVKELLAAIRDPAGVVIRLPRRPVPVEDAEVAR